MVINYINGNLLSEIMPPNLQRIITTVTNNFSKKKLKGPEAILWVKCNGP